MQAQALGEIVRTPSVDTASQDDVSEDNAEVRHRLHLFAEERASLHARLLDAQKRQSVPNFQRVTLSAPRSVFDEEARETAEVCRGLLEAIALRHRYHVPVKPAPYFGPFDPVAYNDAQEREEAEHRNIWGPKFRGRAAAIYQVSLPGAESPIVRRVSNTDMNRFSLKQERGINRVCDENSELLVPDLPTAEEFLRDLAFMERICHDAATKSLCFRRLELLDARFNLHRILNSRHESEEQKGVPHRDFYNVRKVDGHIHHSAIMTQKHLLRFMKRKLKRCPDEVVIERDERFLTLKQVFDSLGLTAYDISIDHLDMHADNTFHRFDRFNLKYNPVGETRLREVFLKTSNLISGRYLAEITKEVFSDLEDNKYVLVEPRLSVYGKSRDEWAELGSWFSVNKLASPNVRWMVQVPRLYSVYRESGLITNFQDLLDNIFMPIFEATLHPQDNPSLTFFLNVLVGFDCVDDESRLEAPIAASTWP